MATKTTLNEIGEMLAHVVKHMATKEDIAEIRREMATKDQVLALQTQVNSIERQLRDTKTEVRLGNLEEKVFCAPRQ
jgi:ribosome-interacting GTPase 1